MFFYRDSVVEAKTKNELFNQTACPVCGGSLTHDRCMPIRYSPIVLLRLLILAGAFALLISFLMSKIAPTIMFLNQFGGVIQERIIPIGSVCVGLLLAFLSIWGELKLGHLSKDNKHVSGLRCKNCGNGFAGLVDKIPVSEPLEDGSDQTGKINFKEEE